MACDGRTTQRGPRAVVAARAADGRISWRLLVLAGIAAAAWLLGAAPATADTLDEALLGDTTGAVEEATRALIPSTTTTGDPVTDLASHPIEVVDEIVAPAGIGPVADLAPVAALARHTRADVETAVTGVSDPAPGQPTTTAPRPETAPAHREPRPVLRQDGPETPRPSAPPLLAATTVETTPAATTATTGEVGHGRADLRDDTAGPERDLHRSPAQATAPAAPQQAGAPFTFVTGYLATVPEPRPAASGRAVIGGAERGMPHNPVDDPSFSPD
ncbi:hypothetical protein ACQEU5_07830 [Marinactinospora thermotolerans]|uniref:hypothetical protein n=1 Tax=Marinactinospora thermotolerans TaxID=531310 RepID=UPI003D8BAF96